jgi:hypothetical protein
MNRTFSFVREALRGRAYLYREAAMATLLLGIFLHAARLVSGDRFFLQYVLTPRMDESLACFMVYAAGAGFAGWKQLRFRSRAHELISKFILGFIVISIPIHAATFFGASPARITRLPMWYSAVEATFLYPAFSISIFRIQSQCNEENSHAF